MRGPAATAHSLPDREQLKRLHQRRRVNLEGHLRFWLSASLFAGATVLLALNVGSAIAIVAAMALGFFQTNWYEAMHWAVHRTLFRSKLGNRIAGHLAGFIAFWPYLHYRDFHLDHHRFTGDPDRDPELLTGGPTEVPATALARIWHVCTASLYFFKANLSLLLRLAFAGSEQYRQQSMPYIRPTTYRQLKLECRASLLGYAAIITAVALTVPMALWYLPFILWVHCTTMLVFALPEHAGLHGRAAPNDSAGDTEDGQKKPNAVAQLAMTRQFQSNIIHRYLAWNGNFHATHHAYPSVPYYAMRQLSDTLGDNIQNQQGSYIGWYLRDDRRRVSAESTTEVA